MKRFKRRKLRKKVKLYIVVIIIAFSIISLKLVSKKIRIESKYIKILTENFLGMNFETIDKPEKTQTTISKVNDMPIIYLYNSHQAEQYKDDYKESYNIDYNVQFASYILSSYLKKYNIYSVVEENSINNYLNEHDYSYGYSYIASRHFLELAFSHNPTLNYFIDIHRDSSAYEYTTCEIDNKSYAKILFVIGLEHDNYEKNLENAQKINEKIKKYNPCLSRGIMKKEGERVNGIYNQDFNENVFLIEVGGQYNKIEEVNNTLEIFAEILNEYIGENKNE